MINKLKNKLNSLWASFVNKKHNFNMLIATLKFNSNNYLKIQSKISNLLHSVSYNKITLNINTLSKPKWLKNILLTLIWIAENFVVDFRFKFVINLLLYWFDFALNKTNEGKILLFKLNFKSFLFYLDRKSVV